MCSSKAKFQETSVSQINGRPVLQPSCNNRSNLLERRNKTLKKSSSLPTIRSAPSTIQLISSSSPATPPISPKLKSPRPPAIKRGSVHNDPNGLNLSNEKIPLTPKTKILLKKKSKKMNMGEQPQVSQTSGAASATEVGCSTFKYSISPIVEAPGSIAAARREQVANMHVQRKMRIAHYGRTKSANFERNKVDASAVIALATISKDPENRCNFITVNSDPVYVAYHDEEWGVPVHNDSELFELLVLTGAQVGSNWTSVLKKRQDFRDAFSGFDAETVSKYTEKKITSISAEYNIELSLVRGVVDNSRRIIEITKEFGTFEKYLWGFVNHKPIATQYKSCHKIPVKSSKSESISKDMVRRGFRQVGAIVIHSFMQASGLTNDHLTSCPRHLHCLSNSSPSQNHLTAI